VLCGKPREEIREGGHQMSNLKNKAAELKDKAQETINAAASNAKRMTDQAIDRSKDAAHSAGKTMIKQGKRLQKI
jgi:hypothetical protein